MKLSVTLNTDGSITMTSPDTWELVVGETVTFVPEAKLQAAEGLLARIAHISDQPFTETNEHLPDWIATILRTRVEAAEGCLLAEQEHVERLQAEVARLRDASTCSCGDVFNAGFKGVCPNCLASDDSALRTRIAELEAGLHIATKAMNAVKFGIDPNDITDEIIEVFDPAQKAINRLLKGITERIAPTQFALYDGNGEVQP